MTGATTGPQRWRPSPYSLRRRRLLSKTLAAEAVVVGIAIVSTFACGAGLISLLQAPLSEAQPRDASSPSSFPPLAGAFASAFHPAGVVPRRRSSSSESTIPSPLRPLFFSPHLPLPPFEIGSRRRPPSSAAAAAAAVVSGVSGGDRSGAGGGDDSDEEEAEDADDGGESISTLRSSLRRHRNRSTLLERALRTQSSELRRANNRVAILRDVASRLKSTNANVTSQLEEARSASSASEARERAAEAAVDAFRSEAESRMENERMELTSRLEEERERRIHLSASYDALVDRMEERETEYKADKERAEREWRDGERKVRAEVRSLRRDLEGSERIRLEADEEVRVVRGQAKEWEGRARRQENVAEELRRQLEEKGGEIRAALEEERAKRRRVKKELAAVREELHASAGNVTAADGGDGDDGRTTDSPETVAQIAAAAVRAAERHEADALSDLDRVRSDLRDALNGKEAIDTLLAEARDERDAALRRVGELQKTVDKREGRLADRLARAEEDVQRLEEEMTTLAAERDEARDKLMDARMDFANGRREEQRRHDRAEREEREAHERQVAELREELARTLAGRVATEARRYVDGEGEVQRTGKSVVARREKEAESSRSVPSMAARVWRRIRSPRSWFGKRKDQ